MVSAEQVLVILRQVANKEVEIEASQWSYCGHTVITARDRSFWVSFFIDCDELDYVDECVIGSDYGRSDDWANETYPLECLSESERCALLSVVTEAEACDLIWAEWCNVRISGRSY